MANPFSKEAHKSHKAKAFSMGHENNLDIPVMRAVGENRAGGVHESSTSMQHKDQAASPGMKRGGRLDGMKVMTGIMAGANGIGRMRKAAKYGPKIPKANPKDGR